MATFKERCSKFFDEADADGTGCLSKLELYKVCSKAGCKKEVAEIAEWFDDLDTNDDGKIHKNEFTTALERISAKDVTEADLRAAFNEVDRDGSGCITLPELKQALQKAGEDPAQADLDMDTNEDGKINYEEFLACWRANQ